MLDPTAAILETLNAAKAQRAVLRVTYQSEHAPEPKDYYGTIEDVGMSTSHECPLFRLRTSEGVRALLCNERLKNIVEADALVVVTEPQPKPRKRGVRSLREDSGMSKREARALGGMIAP